MLRKSYNEDELDKKMSSCENIMMQKLNENECLENSVQNVSEEDNEEHLNYNVGLNKYLKPS